VAEIKRRMRYNGYARRSATFAPYRRPAIRFIPVVLCSMVDEIAIMD